MQSRLGLGLGLAIYDPVTHAKPLPSASFMFAISPFSDSTVALRIDHGEAHGEALMVRLMVRPMDSVSFSFIISLIISVWISNYIVSNANVSTFASEGYFR